MRKKLIAGNWKMYKTRKETKTFFEENLEAINSADKEVVLFVPFTDLDLAVKAAEGSNISVGGQNVHYEPDGAFTGEISCEMLKEIGAEYVLIGHSERRKYFAETDESVNKKLKAVLGCGLLPVVCVGEELGARESGKYLEVIKSQVLNAVNGVEIDDKLVIAYEPVWAIGTGKTAGSEQAEEVCSYIRSCLCEVSCGAGESVRILYGGSVNSKNICDLMSMPNIDGVLVGGASLKPEFAKIVNYDK